MKKCLMLYILVSMLMVSAAPVANAELIRIGYFEDTYIHSKYPDWNFVNSFSITLQNTTNVTQTGLLKINVSKIPPGANINKGTLSFFLEVGGYNKSIMAFQYPDNSWNPSTVTYNNFIRLPTTYLSTTKLPATNCQYFEMDITKAIKNRNGDKISIILELNPKMIPYNPYLTTLTSSNWNPAIACAPYNSGGPPYLIVNYTLNNNSTIIVNSPNGGENWARGTTKTLTWSSSGNPGAYVKIELLKAGVASIINPSTPNDGSFSWAIPSTQTIGNDYKVRVTSTINSAYTDTSNNNFIISSSTPSITVASPNGGETWARGTSQ